MKVGFELPIVESGRPPNHHLKTFRRSSADPIVRKPAGRYRVKAGQRLGPSSDHSETLIVSGA
jgi:hypothetical protein